MLWPLTTRRDARGRLVIGDVPVTDLAAEFGTPLYVYDEATIRERCRTYHDAFAARYPATRIVYAGKAYLSTVVLGIVAEEGLDLDVVSGGELAFAVRSGFPADRIVFHGNNKTEDELSLALRLGVGEIVIDNHHEIDLLKQILADSGARVKVLLRINPGIDSHTHAFRKTGVVDSKFGLLIENGDAALATERLCQIPGVDVAGYHAHVGSQIFEVEPFATAVDVLFAFAAAMRERYGVVPREISPGGGLAIAYEPTEADPSLAAYAAALADRTRLNAERYGFDLPLLTVEPGRSIIGTAGVAVYRVGAIKEIPGIRRYVCVDGGMADNIRPALYGARYVAELANRNDGEPATVTIAGKYCESGDVLIDAATLIDPVPGDLIAIPAAGAYALAMASNYNLACRPAAVLVGQGNVRLMQRRETYDDLLARETGIVAASSDG